MSVFGSLWEEEGTETDRKPKRTNHNELERRRRQAQRIKLEALRAAVPSLRAVERCSTTTIIEKAKEHMDALNDRIKILEEKIERSGQNHSMYPAVAHASDPLVERLQRENSDLRMNFALCPHLAGSPGYKPQGPFGVSPACEPLEAAPPFLYAADGVGDRLMDSAGGDVDQMALGMVHPHSRTTSYAGSFEHAVGLDTGVGVNCNEDLLCPTGGCREEAAHGNAVEDDHTALFHTMGMERETILVNNIENAQELLCHPTEYRASCPAHEGGLLSGEAFVKAEPNESWHNDELFPSGILASPSPDHPFATTPIYTPPEFCDTALDDIDRFPSTVLHDLHCNACDAGFDQGAMFNCVVRAAKSVGL
ncbi:hypothetical protein HDU86_000249 [Geranomyces michiganensis]|nr:hypothetical protein HDU86_000249 [Geranomyces michiganensis]